MYDLKNDSLETTNLAYGTTASPYVHERARLQSELTATMTATGTLPNQYGPPT